MLEAWLPTVLTWIIKVLRQSANNVTIVKNGPQIRNQRHFYATGGPTSPRDTYLPTHPLCHTTWFQHGTSMVLVVEPWHDR